MITTVIVLGGILGYIAVCFLLAWVAEPYLRLRHQFYIAEDAYDRAVAKFFISIFWPIGIPILLFTKGLIKMWNWIVSMDEKADEFWESPVEPENVVDETKSDYRNVSFTERK